MFSLRDREMANKIIDGIKALEGEFIFMHVCGTHQDTLIRHGLDQMLNDTGVKVRQGPGCPVCVTTPKEIEEVLALARSGKTIAVFGDMLKVPGTTGSLQEVKAEGCDVRVVYGIEDAVKLAEKNTDKQVVFIAIGFETTAPTTAAILDDSPPSNFSILSCHRTVPNALRFVAESGEVKLNGLIEPGHVSAIIGTKPYEFLSKEFGVPQVVAGFEPLDLLMGIYMLARLVSEGKGELKNEYDRVVKPEGNTKALDLLEKVFETTDVAWRGFPVIPGSGLGLRDEYSAWDARKRFADVLAPLADMEFKEHPGCKCGEVLRGVFEPEDCPMFGKGCKPTSPLGPCMVSAEGGCAIAYKYGRNQN